MKVLFSKSDIAGDDKIIQKMENIARKHHVPPWITNLMTTWQARIWLAQDKLDAASQWGGERGLDADGDSTYLHEMEYMVRARILIAQGRLAEAARLLQRPLEATETGGRTSRAIEILMLQALAFQAGGDTDRAMITLERALTPAEPEGFIQLFVDEGQPMAELLQLALAHKIIPGYTSRLLAICKVEQVRLTIQRASQPLVEPLTERELKSST